MANVSSFLQQLVSYSVIPFLVLACSYALPLATSVVSN